MREHGLQSHKRRRFRVVTTDSKHAHPVAPNVLERDFEATAPNQKWLADMTYVPTRRGLAVPGAGAGPVRAQARGLGDERDDAAGADAVRAGRCTGLARSRRRPGASLGPRLAVRGQGLPEEAQGARHHGVDEPQGRLLGQRADGIGQRHVESRVRARRALRDAGAGTSKRSSSTSVTTIPSGATPRWATSHQRNSSGAGAPRSNETTKASRMRGTALPTDGRFRFVASDRTGRPWITLIVLRGVHGTGSGSRAPS